MEDARGTLYVQFAIAEDVSLGSPRKPSGFGSITRKLSPSKPIKERGSPVHVLIGLGRLGVDFHDLGLGQESLGSRGGVEPRGGFGRWALFRCRGVVDGRLMEVPGKDVWGDRSPCRGHLCQFVHGLELDRRGLGDRGGLGPCGGLDRWALFCC